MRLKNFGGALLALALLFPAALSAQERHAERSRGWMGIGFEWEQDNARQAVVGQVFPGSPAERAGVRGGDVVLRIDGQPATEEAVDALRERLKPGDSVRLHLRREGREMDQTVVAAERREQMVWVGPGDEGEVFSVRVPRERIRMRMDTVRANIERLLTRVDSLHGRLELLHGDSDVVIRMGRERGEPMRVRRGNVRVYRDSAGGRRVQVDSVIILHDSLLARHRALERAHIEAFPFRDLDPEVPFYMEMGRRGVAGAELVEMNAGLARYFHTDHGLLVAQVSEGTPMARAGVEAGDVIVRAGGADVDDVGDLRRAFSARTQDGKLRLDVVRQGNRRTLELQWEPVQWRVRAVEPRTRARRPAN